MYDSSLISCSKCHPLDKHVEESWQWLARKWIYNILGISVTRSNSRKEGRTNVTLFSLRSAEVIIGKLMYWIVPRSLDSTPPYIVVRPPLLSQLNQPNGKGGQESLSDYMHTMRKVEIFTAALFFCVPTDNYTVSCLLKFPLAHNCSDGGRRVNMSQFSFHTFCETWYWHVASQHVSWGWQITS